MRIPSSDKILRVTEYNLYEGTLVDRNTDVPFTNFCSSFLSSYDLWDFEFIKSGFRSEKIGKVYATEKKWMRFFLARPMMWSLLSIVLHLLFVIMTLQEKKSMPVSSLMVYCGLMIIDSFSSYIVTDNLVDLFKSKKGEIMANTLLKLFFGPLESYLEFQYFGRAVEGYEQTYTVLFAVCISIFDLVREVVDIHVDFKLIQNSNDSMFEYIPINAEHFKIPKHIRKRSHQHSTYYNHDLVALNYNTEQQKLFNEHKIDNKDKSEMTSFQFKQLDPEHLIPVNEWDTETVDMATEAFRYNMKQEYFLNLHKNEDSFEMKDCSAVKNRQSNMLSNIPSAKIVEVLAMTNITMFHLEIFKILFYLFSFAAILSSHELEVKISDIFIGVSSSSLNVSSVQHTVR